MYYVKESATPAIYAISVPDALIPPCDLDETELDAADQFCLTSAIAAGGGSGGLLYFNCSTTQDSYSDTVALISDAKCPGEDR